MQLFLLGVSHHSAPVDLRERVDFSRRGIPAALAALDDAEAEAEAEAAAPAAAEVVVLSTCNRAEIYTMCGDPDAARDALGRFMCEFHDVPQPELAPHLYSRTGAAVARHLFRVAAGLDSLVVGEPQILGQVKDAYAVASERGRTGASLNRLFHWAFSVGKRARAETGIGEGAVSVSFAAISLARKIFGRFDRLRALVVGAGEMAELTATHLRAQDVGRIHVTNRTASRAAALAARVQGTAVSWEGLIEQLASADIVVTATGSPSWIVTRAQVAEAIKPRRGGPLFLIDIGVPRDVEPAAGDLEDVFLYNIDDLQAIVRENQARRQAQVDRAEALVEEEVDGYMRWLRSRGSVPTVVALRRRFEEIRQAELRRLEPKLASMPPAARQRVEEVTRLLVERLLSTPTERLKSAPDEAAAAVDADTISRIFELGLSPDGDGGEAAENETAPLRVSRPRGVAGPAAPARNR